MADIHALMAPGAAVAHNEWLIDRLGHRRQFDVVIRASVAGHDLLAVIECKDLNRKVGTPEVNAFADKAGNVKANLKIIASRLGFTKPALQLAAFHGIASISLVKRPGQPSGIVIPTRWYATQQSWEPGPLSLFFATTDRPADGFDPTAVAVNHQSLSDWLTWLLFAKYDSSRPPGNYIYTLALATPATLQVAESEYQLAGLSLLLRRDEQVFTKVVSLVGDAYYDWHKGRIVLPPGCSVMTEPVKMDLSLWDKVDGPIPDPSAPFEARLILSRRPELVPTPTLDLEALGTGSLSPIAA